MSTAPLPQQRQHPGEGYAKCNPERDARPPLFPNQSDPPPENPAQQQVGAGVDENERAAACGSGPAHGNVTSADDVQRPWTVMVEHGRIVGRYRAEDTHEAGRDATRITLGGNQIDVYEVDAHECMPPQVGEQVDPLALGWVRVS